ncbi:MULTISPECIES: profilin [Streptomyces]|uniref:Profilin n=1 Tax=Streptomyces tricolor TaxID=68277 RepID=A0ABS9JCC2_9ACTN|nr:profilin [Streptomyces tricolor]MCG0063207.1 profilin [Streptomyces tricolor]
MSSWQECVDDHLIGTVSPREGAAIASGFTDNEKIFKEGIDANSRKYLVVHANESSIYGKAGTRGICCVKTTQAILVGVYEPPVVPGAAAAHVEKVADYLIDMGY